MSESVDWSEVTRRVVVEAVGAHPQDVVVQLGGHAAIAALVGRVRTAIAVVETRPAVVPEGLRIEVADPMTWRLPAEASVVILDDMLRLRSRKEQEALVRRLGTQLRPRALLVIGDVMWSMPFDQIDEPEQYGAPLGTPPTTRWIEELARVAGFLPDLHRFGVGRAVLIALRTEG